MSLKYEPASEPLHSSKTTTLQDDDPETMGASFAYHAAALYSKVAHEASTYGIQVRTNVSLYSTFE